MERQISISFFLFSFFFYGDAQNLVPNPSFEFTTCCPTIGDEISNNSGCVPQWFNPNLNTPDYFNFCGGTVPINFGGFQNANTGVAYSGCSLKYNTPNGRDYVETSLLSPLIQGKKYCVEFFVSLSDSSTIAIDQVGACFTTDTLNDITTLTLLPGIPQIQNPNGNIISDKVNWTKIFGSFIATGGEKFITIGNFKDDSNTMVDTLNSNPNVGKQAYYYIDDVSVLECPENIFIPSAFSPNNDGENDILYVRGEKIKDLLFTVFDRVGEKVFETLDIGQGWDGTYRGEKLNSAVFVYYLSGTYTDGTTFSQKGDISLVR